MKPGVFVAPIPEGLEPPTDALLIDIRNTPELTEADGSAHSVKTGAIKFHVFIPFTPEDASIELILGINCPICFPEHAQEAGVLRVMETKEGLRPMAPLSWFYRNLLEHYAEDAEMVQIITASREKGHNMIRQMRDERAKGKNYV